MNTKFSDKSRHNKQFPKYIIPLSMLYITAFMFPMMLAYRMVSLGPLLEPGGTIIFPASYLFGDIVAEIYGYKIARQIIWSAIFCQLLSGVLILFVLHLPYPKFWHYEFAFDIVLGHALRYAIISSIGNFFGEFTNVYLISKFKILFKGKYFWLRSLTSTCFGEAVLTAFVFFFTFIGTNYGENVWKLIACGYIYKLIFACFATFPATLIIRFLKRTEQLDAYDYRTNFNPFKLTNEPSNP